MLNPVKILIRTATNRKCYQQACILAYSVLFHSPAVTVNNRNSGKLHFSSTFLNNNFQANRDGFPGVIKIVLFIGSYMDISIFI